MQFTLPSEFAATLYERQHGRCAVSGVKFDLERFPDALVKHPFAPSIDRILSTGHYTPDNVRLVCVAVNFGMGEWGLEVYMTLARAAVAREAKEQHDPDPQGDSDCTLASAIKSRQRRNYGTVYRRARESRCAAA
jgi:hypothetical protein